MNRNGTNIRQLTNDNIKKVEPVLSFDEKHVFYVGYYPKNQRKTYKGIIYKLTISTGKIEPLDDLDGDYRSCTYYGKNKIIATKVYNGYYKIVLIDINTRKESDLIDDGGGAYGPFYFKK